MLQRNRVVELAFKALDLAFDVLHHYERYSKIWPDNARIDSVSCNPMVGLS